LILRRLILSNRDLDLLFLKLRWTEPQESSDSTSSSNYLLLL
jgi:hypothetical protein